MRLGRTWELDEAGQPTNRTIENRRRAEFITPIAKPKGVCFPHDVLKPDVHAID